MEQPRISSETSKYAFVEGMADVEKKLLKEHFFEKLRDNKRWEYRKEDDWRFAVGQIIKYREVDYDFQYTGRFIVAEITLVVRNLPNMPKDYCIYSDRNITQGGYVL